MGRVVVVDMDVVDRPFSARFDVDGGEPVNKQQLDGLLYQSLETERGGIRIYETAVRCARNDDLKKEWGTYLDETARHAHVFFPGPSPLESPHFDDLLWGLATRSAKTSPSRSELEARRFAPCRPAAHSPTSRLRSARPSRSSRRTRRKSPACPVPPQSVPRSQSIDARGVPKAHPERALCRLPRVGRGDGCLCPTTHRHGPP